MGKTEAAVCLLWMSSACAPAVHRVADGDKDTKTVRAPAIPGDSGEDAWDSGGSNLVWEGDDEVEWAGGVASELFDPHAIHVMELELGSSARSALDRNPTDYVEGRFRWDALDIPVGVRIKGSSSRDTFRGKPSLKLDFNRVVEGLRVAGQKKLNLHNMRYDPMKVSEELVYGMWREAGLPASRTSYAHLFVDGVDYGLYSVVETPDDPFLERWYADPDGNLYENAANYCDFDGGRSCFEAEESDEGNHDALDAMIEAVMGSDGGMGPELAAQLDWERYTGFLAMEASIAHWDSYSFDQSNFRWYHEPTADTWSLIPSSTDLGFGYRPWSYPDCGRHGVDPTAYTMGNVSALCWADASCEAAVLDKMLLVADQMESMDIPGALLAATDRVRDAVYADTRKSTSNSHFEAHLECVEAWVAQRPDELRAWVAARRSD